MIHELRSLKVLLIDPVLFETKCKQLDEFDFEAYLARKSQAGGNPLAAITTDIYGAPLPRPQMTEDGIALIPVKGVLLGDCPEIYEAFGFANTAKILSWIQEAGANPSVKSILLCVNSPGGSTEGIAEIANAVRDIQAQSGKRISAFSSTTVGSAAYWIVAACYGLYGTASSQWGSVGAYRVVVNSKKRYELAGYAVEIFRSGKFKGMGEEGTDLSPEQSAFIQSLVDYNGEAFRAHVSTFRPIDAENLEGQHWYAPEAAARGFLDDVLPGIDEAIATLRGNSPA